MELTIKHLAPYLPYEIEFVADYWNRNFAKYTEVSETLNCVELDKIIRGDYENVNLLLRPLSDLTKEITHNGETFVPIEELYRKKVSERILKFTISDSGTSYFIQWEYEKEHGGETAVDYDSIQKKNILQSISVQDFIYLCSWHFDIFGLIENNLAIDLNTLNQTP